MKNDLFTNDVERLANDHLNFMRLVTKGWFLPRYIHKVSV